MTDLTDIAACPRCGGALAVAGDELTCKPCRTRFPCLDGVPWLFAEPRAAAAAWRARFDLATQSLREQAARHRKALEQDDLPAATRRRIELLATAFERHHGELTELLAPLGTLPAAAIETHLALRTRLPPTQSLTGYAANVFRDWSWGAVENTASFDMVAEVLGERPPGRVLVLGAGAGRLAYDVHTRLANEGTVALDLNPFLVLTAARVTRGESMRLTEFPLAPSRLEHHAVVRSLEAPAPAGDAFRLVLADALRAPFKPGAFDTVLTPWFVDIVDDPLAALARRINQLLAPAGRWVSFGSLAFDAPRPAEALSFEESVEAFRAGGFGAPTVLERRIPYLCCPESRHARHELVVALAADKQETVDAPARRTALPDWIVRGNRPVPLTDDFKQQIMSTRIHAFVMSLIDGKRTLEDMARHMEEQRLMPRQDAEAAIRGFLIRMHDDSRGSRG